MKKFINPRPIPNGGLPLFGGDFVECLQTEVYRAILAQYKSFNEPLIIYGCQVTADLIDETCTITAGMALLDGDLIDVPAYAGAYPVYLVQGDPTNIDKNYKDQTPRTVMVQKTSEWLNDAGDGDSILFDPYTSQYLNDVQRRFLTPLNRCEWFPDYPNADAFDLTGLGKWEWLGYAVANNNNDTADLTGRVQAQFDPEDADLAIGNPYGTKEETLTIDQIPSHTHGSENGFDSGSGSGTPVFTAGASKTPRQLGINNTGGGLAHNNMQKTLAGVVLQRIAYTL